MAVENGHDEAILQIVKLMTRVIRILIIGVIAVVLGGCTAEVVPSAAAPSEIDPELGLAEYANEVAAICDRRNELLTAFVADMEDLREDPAGALERLGVWGDEDQESIRELLAVEVPDELSRQRTDIMELLEERVAIYEGTSSDTTDVVLALIQEEDALLTGEIALIAAELWPTCQGNF